MSDKAMDRRERTKQLHRKEILKTALELFSEKGFHNVSMQEIADKAEFAVGTLYNFFKDKEDLYKALSREKFNIFNNELSKAIDSDRDEVEKIRDFILVKGKVFSENIPMIKLLLSESHVAKKNIKVCLEAELRDQYDQSMLKLAKIFESGIKKGIFINYFKPYYLAILLENITSSFLHLWLEDPEKHSYNNQVDSIMRMFLREKLD